MWRLYRARWAANEACRQADNHRFVERRLTDPALSGLNEEQRRAVLVREDRALIVAGAGTGKTHTMLAKAKPYVLARVFLASPLFNPT